MSCVTLLMDVSPGPSDLVSWGALILILVIITVLAVMFAGGLVFLLIWLTRRKMKDAEKV